MNEFAKAVAVVATTIVIGRIAETVSYKLITKALDKK